ncbi:hypothetical protein KM043_004789 [Ampulex compressa]|nr:hypothetical protein KM043_004789 [Ampulex compressa]
MCLGKEHGLHSRRFMKYSPEAELPRSTAALSWCRIEYCDPYHDKRVVSTDLGTEYTKRNADIYAKQRNILASIECAVQWNRSGLKVSMQEIHRTLLPSSSR